jgi:hypothetical protein
MYLSLCLIVKDENSYIQEWLDYHILQGVEHFWVYDNESTKPMAVTLQEYIDRGWATVNTIQGRAMQMFAYDHCIQTYGSRSKWIGFIDTDEFFVVRDGRPLAAFMNDYEAFSGLAVSSLFFGHGGIKTRPPGGQIAAYQRRAPEKFSYNRLVKSIVKPEAVLFPASPHSFFYKENCFCVNEDGNRVDAQEYPCHVKKIQLNHYFTRSEEEWNRKLSRGRGDSAVPYKDERGTWVQNFASVRDTAILDHLQNIIPGAKEEGAAWKKKVSPNASFLPDLLHREAMACSPTVPERFPSFDEITPRPEAVAYHQELERSILLHENSNFAEAREFWMAQIEKYPFDPNRYLNFADASFRIGDFPSAWNALAQAWRIAPKSLYVMMSMAEYFFASEDYAQAEKTSLLCASLGDLKPEGVALLAISQWRQGKHREARDSAFPLLEQLAHSDVKKPLFKELINLFSENQR